MIGLVVSKADIEDRQNFCILCFSEFKQLDIAGLTVLVGRIVRNIDAGAVIAVFVPVVKKSRDLVIGDAGQKVRNC